MVVDSWLVETYGMKVVFERIDPMGRFLVEVMIKGWR